MARRKITVVCNYPTPENMEQFQNIMCDGIAKALIKSKSPEYIKALKSALEKEIREESCN
ncbi:MULTISPECIES: hypothetical protein [Terrisporobacter]|uniref:Uncharacterized protein n=2 Tax=Terrisporobacter TaxID=1505652 RepID=A0AAX2ZEA0_9FIRM|nr:hypothetical protein [Terrisporobacter hibernicus]UEL47331.1 hypothetical protein JW646_17125 [Terrisporobacter hibernicus]